MSRIVRSLALLLVVALTGATLPGAAPPERTPSPRCDEGSTHADAVVAAGISLCTSADDAEQRLMRNLALAGGKTADVGAVTVDYPRDETVFPPEIAAPTFRWHDDVSEADRWVFDFELGLDDGPGHIRVIVHGDAPSEAEIDRRCVSITNEIYQPTPYQASATTWKPGAALWSALKRHTVDRPATVTVLGFRADAPDRVLSRGRFTFSTSPDPVGAPIFYRDVPLMPSQTKEGIIKPLDQTALPLIVWRLKDISRDDSRALLTDMPTCANCHSFSSDGKTIGIDVDGPDGDKGAYAVAKVEPEVVIGDEQVMTWNAFEGRPEGHLNFGFLSRVSPDGQHVVSTVNEAMYVRNFSDYRFLQVFFPTRGILAVWNRATGEIKALPGADDPRYVQCNAVWSPDGEYLVFARAEAKNPYDRNRPVATYSGDPNETQIRYELYRVPFNDGRGGTPEPIAGASGNGMSNSFPKISPDGKWLVWVQSKNGLLMRPDGKLWIAPAAGGTPRLMRCNTPRMNSWHSFSPNGRWMVFSSKSETPYTQMLLTHIDENGNDSPPVLIEGATADNRAVNIPEFVNTAYDRFAKISVPAVDHYEHFARGNELAREGRRREAVAAFEKALEGEEAEWRLNDWRIHDSLSKVLLQSGEVDRALAHIRESLRVNPFNAEMHANLGYILFERGNLSQAREHLDLAVKLAPAEAQAWYNRAALRLTQGDREGAIEDYTRAIEADPDYAEAYNGRGIARMMAGERSAALEDFTESIRADPDDPAPWYFRARIRSELGETAQALADLDRALKVCPAGSPRCAEIEQFRLEAREAAGTGE
jgi:tetratricopeptide (TPR) repeat protein